MVEAMVLCVDCIKSVGLTLPSPDSRKVARIRSVGSIQPKPVPHRMASGIGIPESARAFLAVTRARFRRFPILLACTGGMNSLKSGSRQGAAPDASFFGASIQASLSGSCAEICVADMMYTWFIGLCSG